MHKIQLFQSWKTFPLPLHHIANGVIRIQSLWD